MYRQKNEDQDGTRGGGHLCACPVCSVGWVRSPVETVVESKYGSTPVTPREAPQFTERVLGFRSFETGVQKTLSPVLIK